MALRLPPPPAGGRGARPQPGDRAAPGAGRADLRDPQGLVRLPPGPLSLAGQERTPAAAAGLCHEPAPRPRAGRLRADSAPAAGRPSGAPSAARAEGRKHTDRSFPRSPGSFRLKEQMLILLKALGVLLLLFLPSAILEGWRGGSAPSPMSACVTATWRYRREKPFTQERNAPTGADLRRVGLPNRTREPQKR